MANIIKIDDNNIVNLLNNKGGLDIGKPFSQEIFLIQSVQLSLKELKVYNKCVEFEHDIHQLLFVKHHKI